MLNIQRNCYLWHMMKTAATPDAPKPINLKR